MTIITKIAIQYIMKKLSKYSRLVFWMPGCKYDCGEPTGCSVMKVQRLKSTNFIISNRLECKQHYGLPENVIDSVSYPT